MLTDLLSEHLRDCGYEPLVANNSGAALKQLPKKPDLILLDINMPCVDGLELCKNIRRHVACPIIFLTARITEQDKVNGLQFGGDDSITKPFSLQELTARTAAHLHREECSQNKVFRAHDRGRLTGEPDGAPCFLRHKGDIFFKKRV